MLCYQLVIQLLLHAKLTFFPQANVKNITGVEITGVILLIDKTIFTLVGSISSSIST